MPKNPKTTASAPIAPVACIPKRLPTHQWHDAAQTAWSINPVNQAPLRRLAGVIKGYTPTPQHIALVTTKYWGAGGVKLTVGFLDNPETALRQRILLHMNAWAKSANVQFVETSGHAQVRIAREGGDAGGYWSYVGTDILSIPAAEPTMNLQEFTMNTLESEYHRVVRHETGHTLGFPHEHMRKALVDLIDVKKAIKYFGDTQGWSPAEVKAQVLTPLEDSSIMGTLHADEDSIMCYQIPGEITKSGKPIRGGVDIDPEDYEFAAKVYPKPATPGGTGGVGAAQMTNATVAENAAVIEILPDVTRVTLQRPGGSGAPGGTVLVPAADTPIPWNPGPGIASRVKKVLVRISGRNDIYQNSTMSDLGLGAEKVQTAMNTEFWPDGEKSLSEEQCGPEMNGPSIALEVDDLGIS